MSRNHLFLFALLGVTFLATGCGSPIWAKPSSLDAGAVLLRVHSIADLAPGHKISKFRVYLENERDDVPIGFDIPHDELGEPSYNPMLIEVEPGLEWGFNGVKYVVDCTSSPEQAFNVHPPPHDWVFIKPGQAKVLGEFRFKLTMLNPSGSTSPPTASFKKGKVGYFNMVQDARLNRPSADPWKDHLDEAAEDLKNRFK